MSRKANFGHAPPRNLPRRGAKREPKLALTIFCEGQRTEPEYLSLLTADVGNALVEIHLIAAAGVPKTLVAKAVAHKKAMKNKNDRIKSRDQVWAVFDRDDHEDINGCLQRARAGGVEVAFSNPCFEIWAYIHFDMHDAPTHRHTMQRMLAEKMQGYDPSKNKTFNYAVLRDKFNEAEERAKIICRRREEENNPLGNPYTDMHILARLIVENGKFSQNK